MAFTVVQLCRKMALKVGIKLLGDKSVGVAVKVLSASQTGFEIGPDQTMLLVYIWQTALVRAG